MARIDPFVPPLDLEKGGTQETADFSKVEACGGTCRHDLHEEKSDEHIPEPSNPL
jgi:hypothetical protein